MLICLIEGDRNHTIWHLEMMVSRQRYNFDVSKIKIPLLGSSKIFKRQFDAASFKRCASTIKTIFFSEFIDFWPRKVLILRIWAILIISVPLFIFFSVSKLSDLLGSEFELGSIIRKSGWLLLVIFSSIFSLEELCLKISFINWRAFCFLPIPSAP